MEVIAWKTLCQHWTLFDGVAVWYCSPDFERETLYFLNWTLAYTGLICQVY